MLRPKALSPTLHLLSSFFPPSTLYPLFSILSLLLLVGCGTPSQVNIELRKKIQGLESQNSGLEQQNQRLRQTIAALEASRPTTRELPPVELKNLYVSYGIKFARLTGGADLDPKKPGDEGIRLYITPFDEQGDEIQAAGSFVVEAFDLDEPQNARIGHWEFPTAEARKLWRPMLLEVAYVLTCPWQTAPRHPNLTVRVTFTDELTKAQFTIQRPISVSLPPQK
jgi:hypothetical protein